MDSHEREFVLRILQEDHPFIDHITYNSNVSICSVYLKDGIGDDLPTVDNRMIVWLDKDTKTCEALILDKFEHQVVLYYEKKGEYDQADVARQLLTQARNRSKS